MALCLLCLGVIFLGALKMQAEKSLPTATPTPPLSKFPQQPDFQYEQFQGKWYCVGVAQNTHFNESQNEPVLQNTIYELNDDHSYNVTSDWVRDGKCEHDNGIILPTDEPGLFSLQNVTHACIEEADAMDWVRWGQRMSLNTHPTGYGGVQNFTVQVLETDYKQYAMVYLERIVHNMVFFKHVLYGRKKELSPEMKEHYRTVAKSLGVPDRYVTFTDQHGKGYLQ
ncbi:neutrophil gelatinase-associated lipocalin-like [Octodon degus]|uniref:Neutrophil gelatinase-associated lipocalin-like n=1 Tax=Octodon degus TaxID=10160 RepID=A0A6P3FND5_OCTDE|nr:neutrophil gelatinase-associated lipocalin-like [Octodon degus]